MKFQKAKYEGQFLRNYSYFLKVLLTSLNLTEFQHHKGKIVRLFEIFWRWWHSVLDISDRNVLQSFIMVWYWTKTVIYFMIRRWVCLFSKNGTKTFRLSFSRGFYLKFDLIPFFHFVKDWPKYWNHLYEGDIWQPEAH